MGEGEEKDKVQLTKTEKLEKEVKTKLSGLLSQDGREEDVTDLGPCLRVEYVLDTPRSIAGMKIPDYDEVDARLIINQKMIKSKPTGRLIAIVKILEGNLEAESFTFIFNEGVSPSIQRKEVSNPLGFFNRETSEEDLADFNTILDQPLYLPDSS